MAKNKPNRKVQAKRNAANTGAAKAVDSKPAASKTAVVNKSSDQSSRAIIIAAVVILLVLAGVGFLVLGITQSLLNQNNPSDTAVENTDGASTDGDTGDAGAPPADTDTSDPEDNTADDADPADEVDTDENTGSVNGDAVSTSDDQPATGSAAAVARTTKYQSTSASYSRGNDYNFGDITGDRYTVKRGDTLWQIAEGRDGSGYAWVDINSANGGFDNLRNGQPVNIPVGYNLVLPNL